MRVVPQISTTTTQAVSEKLGYKRVILAVATQNCYVAFSYRLIQARETDFYTLAAGSTYKFEAPKGKKIWYIIFYAAGTGTLDIMATDGDFEKVL